MLDNKDGVAATAAATTDLDGELRQFHGSNSRYEAHQHHTFSARCYLGPRQHRDQPPPTLHLHQVLERLNVCYILYCYILYCGFNIARH